MVKKSIYALLNSFIIPIFLKFLWLLFFVEAAFGPNLLPQTVLGRKSEHMTWQNPSIFGFFAFFNVQVFHLFGRTGFWIYFNF